MEFIIIDPNICCCVTVECVQQTLLFMADHPFSAREIDSLVHKMQPSIVLDQSLKDVLHRVWEEYRCWNRPEKYNNEKYYLWSKEYGKPIYRGYRAIIRDFLGLELGWHLEYKNSADDTYGSCTHANSVTGLKHEYKSLFTIIRALNVEIPRCYTDLWNFQRR